MDLTVDIPPFNPYSETVRTVIYTLMGFSMLALATGLPLLLLDRIQNWFLGFALAKNIIGIVLVSQWLLIGLYGVMLLIMAPISLIHANYSDLITVLIISCSASAPPSCALLCWHHLKVACREKAEDH